MKTPIYAVPDKVGSDEIRNLRSKLGMSRKGFAALMGVSVKTVEHWENTDTDVTGPVCFAYKILTENPDIAEKLTISRPVYPLRLIYMFRNMICTVIDVDEPNRRIRIKNYVKDPQFCAFGIKREPEFEDYEMFLEERCFAKNVDKRKLLLENLGLPFYDPFMIIEKTEGRMAEDEFWIRVIKSD